MRLVFFGSADFSIPTLEELYHSRHQVLGVVTIPDRPQGRGRKLRPSPVKVFAQEHELPIWQPESLKDGDFLKALEKLDAELFIVVAFRILPAVVFTMPSIGSMNLHPSLLPAYRGPAPIHWALLNGDTRTGVTTFFLKKKVDTGDILLQEEVEIEPDDDFGSLHDKLARRGAQLVLKTVDGLEQGTVKPVPQDSIRATRAPKVGPEEQHLNFQETARQCHNRVRAFAPRPGAFCYLNGVRYKILKSGIAEGGGDPGAVTTVKPDCFHIACSSGELVVFRLQPEGKRSMETRAFLQGYSLKVGHRFA